MNDRPASPFRDAPTDRRTAEQIPDTPQTRAPSYRLAFADQDFLTRAEMRPVRLQLELLKTEMIMAEMNIDSTVVMFGGARIPERPDGRADRDAGRPVEILRPGAPIRAADDRTLDPELRARRRDRHRRRAPA